MLLPERETCLMRDFDAEAEMREKTVCRLEPKVLAALTARRKMREQRLPVDELRHDIARRAIEQKFFERRHALVVHRAQRVQEVADFIRDLFRAFPGELRDEEFAARFPVAHQIRHAEIVLVDRTYDLQAVADDIAYK